MIKILIMDVDGTLTDGKIYIGESGELIKAFNVKDGLMIARLHQYGIIPIIITGRKSEITVRRCEELKIKEVYQGISNKVCLLNNIIQKYNCTYADLAYIGDDINDLDCIRLCGATGAPADAVHQVKEEVDFISQNKGGEGAVREFIEWLVNNSQKMKS